MIAEVFPDGQIMIKSETEQERILIQSFVANYAVDSASFDACCHNKKCSFKLEVKHD